MKSAFVLIALILMLKAEAVGAEGIVTPISWSSAASGSFSTRAAEPQTDPGDSLVVERDRPIDIQNPGLRVLAKAASGTVSSFFVFSVSYITMAAIREPSNDPDTSAYNALGDILFSATIGWTVGFPFGVSAVDPHDSLPITLLAGVVPAVAGVSLQEVSEGREGPAAFLVYIAPVISSLIASEASRKPPASSGASFALSPIPAGALCKVTLRF